MEGEIERQGGGPTMWRKMSMEEERKWRKEEERLGRTDIP
jgi:hypothetical protein